MWPRLTECKGRTGRISARGLGSTDRVASARSVQERPRADILPVRSRANSVNKRFITRLLVSVGVLRGIKSKPGLFAPQMMGRYSLLILSLLSATATATPLENRLPAAALCPPGFWCKRMQTTADSTTCPSDFHCSPSASKREQADAAGDRCPPGYWCRRWQNVIVDETDADSCPPGYWCQRKRHLAWADEWWADGCSSRLGAPHIQSL